MLLSVLTVQNLCETNLQRNACELVLQTATPGLHVR
jgi:hypothetical protein